MVKARRMRRIVHHGGILLLLSGIGWAQTNSCDLNADGTVNAIDVQLAVNQEIGASGFSCTANVGGVLGCSDSARQVIIKAALGGGCHFVYLTWTASSSSGVIGYNIYRGTASGAESTTPLNSSPISGTSFADTTAVSGTTYYYVVKATDGSSESGASAESSATAQ